MKSSEYIVIYDIEANKLRTRIRKLLEGYGFRVQKSCFECRLNSALKRELVSRLGRLNVKNGSVRIYRRVGFEEPVVIGEVEAPEPDDDSAYVL